MEVMLRGCSSLQVNFIWDSQGCFELFGFGLVCFFLFAEHISDMYPGPFEVRLWRFR